MPDNLGEISQLKDGLNGFYQIIESYRKISKVTAITNPVLNSMLQYYEENKTILKQLEKKFKDLK